MKETRTYRIERLVNLILRRRAKEEDSNDPPYLLLDGVYYVYGHDKIPECWDADVQFDSGEIHIHGWSGPSGHMPMVEWMTKKLFNGFKIRSGTTNKSFAKRHFLMHATESKSKIPHVKIGQKLPNGAIVIDHKFKGVDEYVLCLWPDSGQAPYVHWYINPNNLDTIWGQYFSSLSDAVATFERR